MDITYKNLLLFLISLRILTLMSTIFFHPYEIFIKIGFLIFSCILIISLIGIVKDRLWGLVIFISTFLLLLTFDIRNISNINDIIKIISWTVLSVIFAYKTHVDKLQARSLAREE
jgi:hypothetical protein